MPLLPDVWRAAFPAAIAAADPPAIEVGWVRMLKARVPAFDALESGDLAIVPMAALRELVASGAVEGTGVVDVVARAAGSGVLLVGVRSDDPLASELLDRAIALRIGAFALSEGEAPVVERAVIGYLVNDRAELERQAAILEGQLERLALEGGDLEDHAAAIGRFLGRAVAIERPRGRALTVHAPVDVPAAAAAAAAYLAQPRHAALRVRLPDVQERAGALVLLGPAPPSALERVAAERVAGLLALELRRGGAAVDEAAGAGRAAARALPPAGPPWVSIVARQVMLDQPSTVEQRERLRQELRRLEPARRLSLRGDAASLELRLVAVAADDDPLGVGVAARVHGVARRPVAVSRPFREPEQRALAEAEARATLEAVEILRSDESTADPAVGPGPPVARADRLPAYRLLGSLHDIADGQRQARALLAPLFEGRPAAVHARLATLRAVLDGPGLRDAARALGVHRNSLTYRVGRIEAAAGWDLSDPALRFALGIAVRIVQHAQTSGPPAGLEG